MNLYKLCSNRQDSTEKFRFKEQYYSNNSEEIDKIIAKNDNSIDKNDNIIAKNDNIIAKNDNSIAKNDNSIAKNDNSIAKNDNSIAKNDNSIAKNDNSIAKNDNSIAKNDNSTKKAAQRRMSLNFSGTEIEQTIQASSGQGCFGVNGYLSLVTGTPAKKEYVRRVLRCRHSQLPPFILIRNGCFSCEVGLFQLF